MGADGSGSATDAGTSELVSGKVTRIGAVSSHDPDLRFAMMLEGRADPVVFRSFSIVAALTAPGDSVTIERTVTKGVLGTRSMVHRLVNHSLGRDGDLYQVET